MRLYFTGACPPVELDSDEGQRLMLANAAAMNYGYAFRMVTYAALRQLSAGCFGGSRRSLVVDSPHNSIYEEDVAAERAVVHRHNSCRAYPARPDDRRHAPSRRRDKPSCSPAPTERPPTSRSPAAAVTSLHSACHGAGTVIDQFAQNGTSGTDPRGRSTLRFRYSDTAPSRGDAPRRRRGQRRHVGADQRIGSSDPWPGCVRSPSCTRGSAVLAAGPARPTVTTGGKP